MGLLSGPVFAQENEKWHVNYVLAKDAIAKGNYSTAIQHLTWAIAKEGRPARSTRYVGVQRGEYLPYYYLGLAYFKLGEWSKADYNFERSRQFGVIAQMPDEYAQLQQMETVIKQKLAETRTIVVDNQPKEDPDQKDFEQARRLYDQGKRDEALPLLDKVRGGGGRLAGEAGELAQRIRTAQATEQEVQTLARQADEAFRRGDWSAALDKYNEVYRKKPAYPHILDLIDRCKTGVALAQQLNRARGLLGTDLAKAEELYDAIRQQNPAFPGLDALGRQLAEEKKRKEASERVAMFNKYYQEGMRALQERAYDRAKRRLTDALKLSDSPAREKEIRDTLASIEVGLQQAQKVNSLLASAKQALQDKQTDRAIQILQQVLAADPANNEAKSLLAVLQAAGAGSGQAEYRQLLKNGVRDFFVGNYADAVATLKNYLLLSGEQAELTRFFIGAALVHQHFLSRERSAKTLDEGRQYLREVRGAKEFSLPARLRRLISPRVLQLYDAGSG